MSIDDNVVDTYDNNNNDNKTIWKPLKIEGDEELIDNTQSKDNDNNNNDNNNKDNISNMDKQIDIDSTQCMDNNDITNNYKGIDTTVEEESKLPKTIRKPLESEGDEELIEIYRSQIFSHDASEMEVAQEAKEDEELSLAGWTPCPNNNYPSEPASLTNRASPMVIDGLSADLANVLAMDNLTNEQIMAEVRLHCGVRLLIRKPDLDKVADVAVATSRCDVACWTSKVVNEQL